MRTWLFDLDFNMQRVAVLREVYATWFSLSLFQYSNFQYYKDKLRFLASDIYAPLASNLNNKNLAVNVGL